MKGTVVYKVMIPIGIKYSRPDVPVALSLKLHSLMAPHRNAFGRANTCFVSQSSAVSAADRKGVIDEARMAPW